ncbi:NAD(P)/FAD-dependent oxidoreductase [Halarsenatibacter silvermanii]|uniref:Pyridine nucleotide-disulphide oxidoreductase n=1 Tax=Halarsenatibacter silvermanii TaxID=321763 RepID=A0A1G9N3T5_9FIRM|nr:FAD-dependent oxidoreductase [Halarsenatibacter silvermanii]SDL81044.1 Pyridine nucleotide-disulphide oxidoreductase [Halarsenatibacter silvermanii]
MTEKIAIIGAGPAGLSAARTLRSRGCGARIRMFSAEKAPPYAPASLGRYLIEDREDILYWQGRDICKRLEIDEHRGEKVVKVESEEKALTTAAGREYAFDKLLIASGSSLKISEVIEGHDKEGLLNFKDLSATRKIKKLAASGRGTAVIIGGGFIGVEIALCLAEIGIKPSVLNRRSWIMPRLLDRETAGRVVADLEEKGVDVRLNTEGKYLHGEERVEAVETTSGDILKADIYIAATGVSPNTDFLQNSGVEYEDWGIPVDGKLRTNHPHIFACGDAALTRDFLSGELTSHGLHPVAVRHGRTAAVNIMGAEKEYERMFSMNSLKELSYKLIVVGELKGEIIRDESEEYLRKIYLKDDKINGFVLLGNIVNAGIYRSLLKNRREVSGYRNWLISPQFNPQDRIYRSI